MKLNLSPVKQYSELESEYFETGRQSSDRYEVFQFKSNPALNFKYRKVPDQNKIVLRKEKEVLSALQQDIRNKFQTNNHYLPPHMYINQNRQLFDSAKQA